MLEATVPPGSPGAVHFQQSLYMLDEEGKRVRYELDGEGNRTGRVQYPRAGVLLMLSSFLTRRTHHVASVGA